MFVNSHIFGHHLKRRNPKRGHGTFLVHIYDHNMPEIQDRLREGHPAVVPLREPRKVARSWKAKGKDLGELEHLWHNLIDIVATYNPVYLPIEAENRDAHLQRVGERVGEQLTTDWPMVRGGNPGWESVELTEQEGEIFSAFDWFYDAKNSLT